MKYIDHNKWQKVNVIKRLPVLVATDHLQYFKTFVIKAKLDETQVHIVRKLEDVYGYQKCTLVLLSFIPDWPKIEDYCKQHHIKFIIDGGVN